MTTRFNPRAPSIWVLGYVEGPAEGQYARFAVDTGSARTVLRPELLRLLGCDLAHPVGRVWMTAATGQAAASVVRIERFTALGRTMSWFEIVAHELPARFGGDGLLGRDFFAGHVLTIDFAAGAIGLRRPRRWWPFGR